MDSTKINILYDHYKETYKIIVSQNTLRDKLFVYLLIALTFMFLQINAVDKINDIGLKLAEKFLGVSLSLSTEFISTMFWFITLSLVIKYAKTLVYIEKQYDYIHELESRIDKEISNDKLFSREGFSYLNNYPKFSNWVWALYTVVFPVTLLGLLSFKICTEYKLGFDTPLLINSIFYIMIVVSVVLYMIKIHFSDNSNDSEDTADIII